MVEKEDKIINYCVVNELSDQYFMTRSMQYPRVRARNGVWLSQGVKG